MIPVPAGPNIWTSCDAMTGDSTSVGGSAPTINGKPADDDDATVGAAAELADDKSPWFAATPSAASIF